MASRIATQLDAYNIGGTKPSGYVATKCCTNAMAISCGCENPGYASNRLVPENNLKVNRHTLTVTITGDYMYYDAQVIITNTTKSVVLAQDIIIGNHSNHLLDLQFEIEDADWVLINAFNANYKENGAAGWKQYANMTWEGDYDPYVEISDNSNNIDLEVAMRSSREIIIRVIGT